MLMRSLFQLSNKYGASFSEYVGKSLEVIKLKRTLFAEIGVLSESLPEGLNKNAQKSISRFLSLDNDIFEIITSKQNIKAKNLQNTRSTLRIYLKC